MYWLLPVQCEKNNNKIVQHIKNALRGWYGQQAAACSLELLCCGARVSIVPGAFSWLGLFAANHWSWERSQSLLSPLTGSLELNRTWAPEWKPRSWERYASTHTPEAWWTCSFRGEWERTCGIEPPIQGSSEHFSITQQNFLFEHDQVLHGLTSHQSVYFGCMFVARATSWNIISCTICSTRFSKTTNENKNTSVFLLHSQQDFRLNLFLFDNKYSFYFSDVQESPSQHLRVQIGLQEIFFSCCVLILGSSPSDQPSPSNTEPAISLFFPHHPPFPSFDWADLFHWHLTLSQW